MITKNFNLETSTGKYTNYAGRSYRVLNTGVTILNNLKFKFSVGESSSILRVELKINLNTETGNNYIVNEVIENPGTEYIWTPKKEIQLNWMDFIYVSLNSKNSALKIYYNTDPPLTSWITPVKQGGTNLVMGISCTTEEYVNITGKNEGFPWTWNPTDDTQFVGYEPPKPLNSWKLDTNNRGYPWSWGFTETPIGQNIFFKTETGITPLIPYINTDSGILPITYIKTIPKGG